MSQLSSMQYLVYFKHWWHVEKKTIIPAGILAYTLMQTGHCLRTVFAKQWKQTNKRRVIGKCGKRKSNIRKKYEAGA